MLQHDVPFVMPSRPLVVVAAGGILETALLPYHLVHLQSFFDVSVAVALSPSALHFVTETALRAISRFPVFHEGHVFDPSTQNPLHISYSKSTLLIIYPASARIVASCALGLVTCPVTRLFAFTPKNRIVIGTFLHPNMEIAIYRPHLQVLAAMGCKVLQYDPGRSSGGSLWPEVEATIAERLPTCVRGGGRDAPGLFKSAL
jgi:phosphopantothenoylcysteine synthetase/decarboxylase